MRVHPRVATLSLLGAFYLAQGLPFGFQDQALPFLLRKRGASLAEVGFLGALAAPWMFKALWAPLVDRWWSPRLGRRRSWILPLQALMTTACLVAAAVHEELRPLLFLVFLMNLFAATQDIAVDGLAVDTLGKEDLGPGNAVQYVGYRTGMILGGGVLVWASAKVGWGGLFIGMALVTAAISVVALLWREPPPPDELLLPASVGGVLSTLEAAVLAPGGASLLAFIGTYRLGQACFDVMYKPFLVDAGISLPDYGLWVGTWGALASVAGALLGGFLATRVHLVRVLSWALVLRCVPMCGGLWLSLQQIPSHGGLVANLIVEHVVSGVLTTSLFAFMMSRVDRRIGASHYTLLASVEVIGKMPGALSGLVADRVGYALTFWLGTALSLVVVPLLLLTARPTPADMKAQA